MNNEHKTTSGYSHNGMQHYMYKPSEAKGICFGNHEPRGRLWCLGVGFQYILGVGVGIKRWCLGVGFKVGIWCKEAWAELLALGRWFMDVEPVAAPAPAYVPLKDKPGSPAAPALADPAANPDDVPRWLNNPDADTLRAWGFDPDTWRKGKRKGKPAPKGKGKAARRAKGSPAGKGKPPATIKRSRKPRKPGRK